MSKKNMKQGSKDTTSGTNNRSARISAKRSAEEAILRKRILITGGIMVAVAAVLSLIMIWYYGEPTLARVNGTRLRTTDVSRHMSAAESVLWGQQYEGDWDRGVREEAARLAALYSLYEDYGRRLGVSFTGHETLAQMRNTVSHAIIQDPESFANFERYMPEDPLPAALARATDILERVRAGEDFDTLMHTYSEDTGGLMHHPDGYTFLAEQMVPEFSEGTLALEIGEVSDLVETIHGFHIIMRIEPDPYNRFPGAEDAPEEDLLGAKHILIGSGPSLNERMQQAIESGFQSKLENANIVFRRALYNESL